MRIFYTTRFLRKFKKIPNELKEIIRERSDIFQNNVFDSRLKTHKLKGPLSGKLSFSITSDYRIMFEFLDNKKDVLFIDVGNHSIYK